MKPDERQFLIAIFDAHRTIPVLERPFADAIAEQIGLNAKRAIYILEKWSDRGWWNSGVTLRTGWLEPEGVAAAERVQQ